MKNTTYRVIVTAGIFALIFGVFWNILFKEGIVTSVKSTNGLMNSPEHSVFHYNITVRNEYPSPTRLCGGQLNWCEEGGCYKVITPLPITLEQNQEATIIVAVTPRKKLSETELTLYVDGEKLGGLTPITIKLPAISRNRSL